MLNRVNRASQFMPFDALSGFREALKLAEKHVEEKKILGIDYEDFLNEQFKQLLVGDFVEVTYYNYTEYMKMIGVINKIDLVHKLIYISNLKIPFQEVICLKKLEKN